jgi:hypothetical protein
MGRNRKMWSGPSSPPLAILDLQKRPRSLPPGTRPIGAGLVHGATPRSR